MAKRIAASTNKGGSLKTSIVVNLGGALSMKTKLVLEEIIGANKNAKVLLVDIDNQGNVSVSFGINPDEIENTIYDVMMGNCNIKDAIISITDNLDIIAANDDMSFIEIDVLTNPDKYPNPLDLLSDKLDEIDDQYDFIIIDTPPQMGMIAANVFNAVEDVIIPYHPEVYSFRSMVKSIRAIENFKTNNPKLNIKAVVPVKVRNVLTHEAFLLSARAFCEQNGIKFTETIIPESIKYAEAIGMYKMPITMNAGSLKVINEYKQIYFDLAKELGYIG